MFDQPQPQQILTRRNKNPHPQAVFMPNQTGQSLNLNSGGLQRKMFGSTAQNQAGLTSKSVNNAFAEQAGHAQHSGVLLQGN